jgi:hypothetical protein
MAAPLAAGEIKSTDKPSALLELAQLVQAAELTVPVETRPNNVTITIDGEASTATVSAVLPVIFSVDATGKIVVDAVDYIP